MICVAVLLQAVEVGARERRYTVEIIALNYVIPDFSIRLMTPQKSELCTPTPILLGKV